MASARLRAFKGMQDHPGASWVPPEGHPLASGIKEKLKDVFLQGKEV